jgi:hypothetical protein
VAELPDSRKYTGRQGGDTRPPSRDRTRRDEPLVTQRAAPVTWERVGPEDGLRPGREGAIRQERERNYQQTYYRYALLTGCSMGALGGLAVGFVPSWIVSGIVGWFRGLESGWNWFLLFMLASASAGALIAHANGFAARWVASTNRDPGETKTIGLLISIPSLLVCLALGLYWIVQAINAPERARMVQQFNASMPSSFVRRVVIARDIANGVPVGAGSQFVGPTPIVFYLEYQNATPDYALEVWLVNARNDQIISTCKPESALSTSGNWSCNWGLLQPGTYFFEPSVHIYVGFSLFKPMNSYKYLGKYYFSIT